MLSTNITKIGLTLLILLARRKTLLVPAVVLHLCLINQLIAQTDYIISLESEKIKPKLSKIEGLEIQKLDKLTKQKEVWRVSGDQEDFLKGLETYKDRYGITVNPLDHDFRDLFGQVQEQQIPVYQQRLLDSIRSFNAEVSLFKSSPSELFDFALETGFDKKDGMPQEHAFKLSINDSKTLNAIREDVGVSKNGYRWQGRIDGDEGSNVFLVGTGEEINGTILYEEDIYNIQPIGNGLHAISKKDELPPDHPNNFDNSSFPENEQNPVTRDDRLVTEAITLDVIVAYTASAANKYLDIKKNLIELAIEETNATFRNSGIFNIKLNLVHAYQTSYIESVDWDYHLESFATNQDLEMDEIHELRELYNADIAVLIIDHPNSYCGEAKEIYAKVNTAFVVVNHNCATGYYSFGHEIGHLLGCRHDHCVDDDVPFAYGHGYLDPNNEFRSVMGYGNCCNRCKRHPFWSNPDIPWKEKKAGTDDKENNVRVIREQAKKISEFY